MPKNSPPLFKLLQGNFGTASHAVLVSMPVGIIVGAAIAGYDYLVNVLLWDNFTRNCSPIILCALPIVGMMLTGIILRTFKIKSSAMADEVVKAYHDPKKGLDLRHTLPKAAASLATMGFGASAGMEGASKWLGAAIATGMQRFFNRLKILNTLHGKIEVTMLAGAAAGISAIFRAPLTGAIMGVESPYKKGLAHDALIHALIASAMSYATFVFLRNATPYFLISFRYQLNLRDLIFCVPVGILAGLSSHLFLGCLQSFKNISQKFDRQPLAGYLVGGILLSGLAIAMFFLIGEPATLQAGLPIANRLMLGQYALLSCLLIFGAKLLATAITFGMGGVGGLFLPSATIGAALGANCDLLFMPSQPGLFTLVGIAAFTGASYNSLLFSAVFIAEASGNPALVVPGLIASSIAYLVGAGVSNSPSQK